MMFVSPRQQPQHLIRLGKVEGNIPSIYLFDEASMWLREE